MIEVKACWHCGCDVQAAADRCVAATPMMIIALAPCFFFLYIRELANSSRCSSVRDPNIDIFLHAKSTSSAVEHRCIRAYRAKSIVAVVLS
jgi:hypothetical protein